ncbi:glycosyl transferase [candidate division KSB3 bacterium]|uniref:Glycosyl transferase n=1 Tax=candidate division KSB3 bacterium TaxID=2044937 RepID=A0A2G6E6I0_9BACT|nr:MAG: glycosyl transferase [candidate division KSB3 bacterium]PIE29907.1 MAG: glycosyl transferase [candidate division KSB3 bacterium]
MQTISGLVSIVIVNRNGGTYLPSCLNALAEQSCRRLEVILVDNASQDNSFQVISDFRKKHPEVALRVIKNSENVGFCRGNNQAMAVSSGEFILALNADVTLEAEFVAVLVGCMNSLPSCGLATGKLLSADNPKTLDSAGIKLYKTRRTVDRGQQEEDCGQYGKREDVFGGSGAACLYRRRMLEEIKYGDHEYFDELFFAYKEDTDLAWRARLRGWRCVYDPDARGRHFRNWGRGKRTQIPRWIRCHSLKNRYLILLKNERLESLRCGFFHLLGYEVLSILYLLFREPYLWKAFWMLFQSLPEGIRKRRLTQADVQSSVCREYVVPWLR